MNNAKTDLTNSFYDRYASASGRRLLAAADEALGASHVNDILEPFARYYAIDPIPTDANDTDYAAAVRLALAAALPGNEPSLRLHAEVAYEIAEAIADAVASREES